MRRLEPFLLNGANIWIATVLVVANLLAWFNLLQSISKPYIVEPIRDPEIVTLLDYIRSGDHSGETWEVTLTELEAEQTITWYLQRYPQIPFAHPDIEITPGYVAGEGDATIAGLRVPVGGKARVDLNEKGLPIVDILELSLPIPGPIRETIERQIQFQLGRAKQLPVRFTEAEWYEGKVVVRGYIR
ncbi:MAG: hypothetical protein JW953_24200 [Anaerolineae bacterium]|nr:hypothetical protein [Anaerolineae bacterium]